MAERISAQLDTVYERGGRSSGQKERQEREGRLFSVCKPRPDKLFSVHCLSAVSKEKQHSQRCSVVQSSTAKNTQPTCKLTKMTKILVKKPVYYQKW